MRTHLILLFSLCLLGACNQSLAQETGQKFKRRIYRTQLLSNDSVIIRGYLTGISDSSVLISSRKQRFGMVYAAANRLKNIHYSEIPELSVKRKGTNSKGFWIGALSGMTIGILIGKIEENHSSPTGGYPGFSSTAAAYGLLGFAGGGFLGLIYSSAFKKTFIIRGKKEEFDRMRATVLEMTYSKVK